MPGKQHRKCVNEPDIDTLDHPSEQTCTLIFTLFTHIFFTGFRRWCVSSAPSWNRAPQRPVSTAQQQPRLNTMAWTISYGYFLRKDWSTIWPVCLTAWICPGIWLNHIHLILKCVLGPFIQVCNQQIIHFKGAEDYIWFEPSKGCLYLMKYYWSLRYNKCFCSLEIILGWF